MNSILLLTRLQVKQMLGGVRSAIEKKTGANGAMAGTVLIGLALLGGLGWVGYSAYGMVGGLGFATTIYNVLFLACGLLTFTFTLPAVLSTFFGSSDIYDLLPLPVSPFAIVLSKALGALSSAYLWTFLIIAGPLAGWGIAAGASIRYWIVYVLAIILTPLMPTAYAGTISIIIAAVFKRVRRKDAITTITTVLTLGLSLGGYVISSNLHLETGLTDVLGEMGDTMGSVVMAFPAYGFAVYAFVHPDPLGTWMFVLLSLAAFAVFVVVARVLYMRIVTSLSSGAGDNKVYDGSSSQEKTPVLKALVRTEIRKIVRNSSVLLNYVAYPLVIAPMLFGGLLFSDSVTAPLDNLMKLGDPNKVIAGFALTFVMFLVVTAVGCNKIAATGISREGSNWMYMKFIPVPMEQQVLAKVLPGFFENVIVVIIIMAAGGYVLVTRLGVSVLLIASGAVLMLGAVWLMTCVQAWTESRSPNVQWGNDGDVNIKTLGGGGATLRALLVGFVYTVLPLLVTPLVSLDPYVFMPILAVAGVVVAVVVGRLLLSITARNIEVYE